MINRGLEHCPKWILTVGNVTHVQIESHRSTVASPCWIAPKELMPEQNRPRNIWIILDPLKSVNFFMPQSWGQPDTGWSLQVWYDDLKGLQKLHATADSLPSRPRCNRIALREQIHFPIKTGRTIGLCKVVEIRRSSKLCCGRYPLDLSNAPKKRNVAKQQGTEVKIWICRQ